MGFKSWTLGFVLASLIGPAAQAAPKPIGSIGFYSLGCLDSETRIHGTEAGLLKLFIERERWYGNPMMIELLGTLGLAYYQDWQLNGGPGADPKSAVLPPYERIQLGDIAQKGGGRMTRHASHQTGLDVDIVYMRKDHRETKADRGAEVSFDELFVKNNAVTPNLDEVRQWWLWKWVQATGKVDRIFVDKHIKKFFCDNAEKLEPNDKVVRTAILRMLRPYPDHADHFHMRLVCPAGDARCAGDPAVAAGSGCSATELDANSSEMEGHSALAAESLIDDRTLPKECSKNGSFPEP